ncbi:MAG: hypothetical protein ACUVUF_06970 [Candidatus Bathycorpusculaceae bacterium]
MGWNCPVCGSLLKPLTPTWQMEIGKPRIHVCPNCKSRFLVWEGRQPRPYLNSLILCVDDGEGKLEEKGEQVEKGNPEEIFRWFSKQPKDEEFANLLDETVVKKREGEQNE